MPETCIRAHTKVERGRLRCKGYAETIAPPQENGETNLDQAIRNLTPTQQYLLRDLQYSEEDINAIADSIANGTAIAISDGSFVQSSRRAAFQFRMETGDRTNQVKA